MAAKSERAAAAQPELVPILGAERLTGAGPHAVSAGGHDLILLRIGGGPRVYQGRCPHQVPTCGAHGTPAPFRP